MLSFSSAVTSLALPGLPIYETDGFVPALSPPSPSSFTPSERSIRFLPATTAVDEVEDEPDYQLYISGPYNTTVGGTPTMTSNTPDDVYKSEEELAATSRGIAEEVQHLGDMLEGIANLRLRFLESWPEYLGRR